MKPATKRLPCILAILSFSFAASAFQPTIASVNLGADAGKSARCTGHLYMAPQVVNCTGREGQCANILIEKCPIRAAVDAVSCNNATIPKATLAALQSAKIDRTAMENHVLDTMKETGQPFIQGDKDSTARYETLMNTEITKNMTISVKGNVDSCHSCKDCYPPAQCMLSKCEITILRQ